MKEIGPETLEQTDTGRQQGRRDQRTDKGDETQGEWRRYLFVDGAVVVGGGDVVVLRVKESLLVVQQLC